MTTRIRDLPPEVVGDKILSKVPITSLGVVRSTCKSWSAISEDWILGKEAATSRQQFVGFMTMDSKVCSLRFQLRKDKDLGVSIKQVDLLNEVKISKVINCNGLFLCIAKDNTRLVVWNPYLGKTRWIGPRTRFHRLDTYAFGCDINKCNHKILRLFDVFLRENHLFVFEIYDLSSNSWRVLDVTPDFEIQSYQRGRGASVKGNTYFFAQEKIVYPEGESMIEDFLLCFDFTRERFGPRLPLPFHSYNEETVAVSSLRKEQLAVLYQQGENPFDALEIWVTTMIEPNAVSWMSFLRVETMSPIPGLGFVQFDLEAGSFFIDEEEKVAVVFDIDGYEPTKTAQTNTVFIFGEDGYFKSVSLGEAPNVGWKPVRVGYISPMYCRPLVSSFYLPSLVQLNQPSAPKERDDSRFVSCKSKC